MNERWQPLSMSVTLTSDWKVCYQVAGFPLSSKADFFFPLIWLFHAFLMFACILNEHFGLSAFDEYLHFDHWLTLTLNFGSWFGFFNKLTTNLLSGVCLLHGMPSTFWKYASRWIGYAKLPQSVNVCAFWCHIQGVISPHSKCSQNRPWLYHDQNKPDQDIQYLADERYLFNISLFSFKHSKEMSYLLL